MRGRVDLLRLLNRYVGVDLRAVQIGMTEHLLNETDVRSVLQHQGRHAMAKEVTRAALADIGFIHIVPHQVAEMIEAERLSGSRYPSVRFEKPSVK